MENECSTEAWSSEITDCKGPERYTRACKEMLELPIGRYKHFALAELVFGDPPAHMLPRAALEAVTHQMMREGFNIVLQRSSAV